MTGTVRSGCTCRRPARSAGAPSHSAAGEARTPAAQIRVFASSLLAAVHDALGGAFGDRLAQHDLDADTFQRALRIGREIVGEACQHARAGLDQHHACLVGVDVAEVRRQRVARQFGDGAGEFDAGRAGADDDEGQQRRAPLPDRSRARRARTRPGCAGAAWWRPPASSGRARTAPIRRGRNKRGARRWRAPACRRAPRRRHRAARACAVGIDAAHRGKQGRDLGRGRAADSGSARRSRRSPARRSRPDRAAAGTDDGCGGRSA